MQQFITIQHIYEFHNIQEDVKIEGIALVKNVHRLHPHYTDFKHQFDGLLLSFCSKGSLRIHINFQEYTISQGDWAVVLPQLILDPQEVSDDFEVTSILMSLDFISAYPILREFITNNEVRHHPVICPRQQNNHPLDSFLYLLEDYYFKQTIQNKKNIIQYIIFALITAISDSYQTLCEQRGIVKTRKAQLVDDFYLHLSQHYKTERQVTFYAEKLHLTPQYLTTLVKKETGHSLTHWIEHVVILHAKSLLKSSDLSINEISYELHFADTSLFCRYFKRCTQLTPAQFRALE
ncbi:AraC family transcriptional regulator [Myroides sp. WP-1]|uniref:helix-turn-helix transcriptional regulator n=1 Tax=Myroides sp. WP-1 TaxID=2759944 RepID=UPI0015FD7E84|nr:AraC family transcriptional regulator [Myroides sp. WP-1]MBB1139085.1 helix-turn-helix transcriptional regulator [Myroides sp. WP-1]